MAKFRATIATDKIRGPVASRLGHRWVETEAQSWAGKIVVNLELNEKGEHEFRVTIQRHENMGPQKTIEIASGKLEDFISRRSDRNRRLDANN